MMKSKNPEYNIADIHCHILPGVDDGANNMEEALRMLSIAEKEGISKIVCTPHFKGQHKGLTNDRRLEIFHALREASQKAGHKIELFIGNEISYYAEIEDDITNGEIRKMNASEYLLIEFHPQDSYRYIRNAVENIISTGQSLVLAHVERYECLTSHMEYVEELHQLGIRLQINAGSIIGKSGFRIKKFVGELLKRQLVDYVATDAHGPDRRTPQIQRCYEYLSRKYDEQYVQHIMYKNAVRDFELE